MRKWMLGLLIFLFLSLTLYSFILGRQVKQIGKTHQFFSQTPTPTISSSPSVTQAQQEQPALSVVAENLEIPWGLTFLPERSILFTERPGRVRFIDAQGNLRPEPVATISDVYANGEGGLLGITLHPKFSENQFVYLYYSYRGAFGSMKNKVVRYVFDGNHLINPKTMIDGIPGNSNHDGGRIKFGPDGFLYITTGDSEDPSLAQSKDALAGKILRITDEGQTAPSNPFNTPIYSYGHRNPQGLAWDDQGRLWATEHGRSAPTGYDELNLIEKGQNYGWPTIQGDEKKEGMVTPVINSGPTTTWAPSGLAYLNGSLFFGGLKGQALYEAVLSGTTVTNLKKHFDGQLGRIRDVVLGPDGMLYITTSNRDGRGTPQANDDKIYRVNPTKLE